MKHPVCVAIGFAVLAQAAFADFAPTVLSSAGSDPAAVRAAFTAFQNSLGPLNAPGANGDPSGRREINWDAVPVAFASPNALPPDFFNKNSVRGAVFSSENSGWSGFQVSTNAADGPVRFENLRDGNSSLFQVFSAEKLFTSIGSVDYNVDFFVPGTQTKGKVAGFGAIFTNVAIPFSSSIEFFNGDGLSLGKFYVPVAPKGLSFVGVQYPVKMVARVRIVQGTVVMGSSDSPADGRNVVALDDFVYSEPVNDCVVK